MSTNVTITLKGSCTLNNYENIAFGDINRYWTVAPIILKGSCTLNNYENIAFGDINRYWTVAPIILKGSAKIGDMDVGCGYGTAYINGKRVVNISHNGKTISSIYLGANKLLSFGGTGSVAMGDIRREWVAGGRIIQGSAKIGDMDTNVAYGDIKRQWTTGGGIVVPEVTFTENYKLDSSGNEVAESGTLLSSYIQTEMVTSITYYGMTAFLAEYNADKVWIDYWNAAKDNSGNTLTGARTINLTGGATTAYMRFCVLATNMDNCYLYDETNKKYLYKGANITSS